MSDHTPIEQTVVFSEFVLICDEVWDLVVKWSDLARRTVGEQVIRSADSVGANLVEGDGRYSDAEAIRFFVIARSSARETRYWINRAVRRKLIEQPQANDLLDRLVRATKALNGLIAYRRSSKNQNLLKEEISTYAESVEDVFSPLNA